MFGKKRPWKKYACIERVELNDGDVKFDTFSPSKPYQGRFSEKLEIVYHRGKMVWRRGRFESLTEAEADLDAWWAEWWPAQTKSTRRA